HKAGISGLQETVMEPGSGPRSRSSSRSVPSGQGSNIDGIRSLSPFVIIVKFV
ncbi:hypothetical protein FRX31_004647, partial [Thalictrum thalictroides]